MRMKSKLFFKFFVLAVIAAFVTVTSCKDYDDDIKRLDGDITAIKADYASKLDALKTELTNTFNGRITTLEGEISALTTKVNAAATKADIDAAKTEILGKVVLLETFNTFKTTAEADIAKLKIDVAAAATKAELAAVETALATELGTLKTSVEAMGLRITTLETNYADLLAKHDADVLDLIAKIAAAKSELELRLDAVDALIAVIEGDIEDIQVDLADQLVLINANKQAIVDLQTELTEKLAAVKEVTDDLQDQITANYNDLNGKITANTNAISALTTRVGNIEADIVNVKQSIVDLETKLGNKILSVYQVLDHRVYTLTFIPDYTSDDGTPQIVVRSLGEWAGPTKSSTGESWATKTAGTSYKGYTILKYNVSPANVASSDFDVLGLVQKVSLVRSNGDDFLVLDGEATLANGILSVPVLIASDTYNLNTTPTGQGSATNISVALQVENLKVESADDTENRVVTSTEYVKVNYDRLSARVALKDAAKVDGTLLPVDITYATIAASSSPQDLNLWNGKGQGGAADAPNGTAINLNNYVYTTIPSLGDLPDFGFTADAFLFELVDLPNEGTDQSNNYVTLDGTTGVISVKPAGTLVNQAAVGRTPIVLVKAVVEGKVYAVGYLKIRITDQFNTAPVKFDFTLSDYTLDCNSTHSLTSVDIAAIDFDQVFNHARIQLGKDAFFAEYSQGNPIVTTLVSGPAGAVASDIQFSYNINPATGSVDLENYLLGTIKNTAIAGTYVVKTVLSSNGYRPNVEITWTFTVKLPTYSLTPNTAYFDNGKIIVNPSILEQGGKTSTVYEALLNNAFMHANNSFTYTPLPEACAEYLTPYFIFTAAPAGYTISTDKKQLLKNGNVAAEIVQDGAKFYIRLQSNVKQYPNQSWNNYKVLSEEAKGLVGTSEVKVQPRGYINGVVANNVALYDPFNVEFVYPLHLALPTDAAVYDQANDGNNTYVLNLYDPNILVDWNGKVLDVTTEAGRDLIDHYEVDYTYNLLTSVEWVGPFHFFAPGRVARPGHQGWWYKNTTFGEEFVSPFLFDGDNVTCNIKPDGTIDANNVTYPIPAGTDLKSGFVSSEGTTEVWYGGATATVPATFTFTWVNGATGAIQNDFKIAVPVSVKHKWGVVKGSLVITVKKGSGN